MRKGICVYHSGSRLCIVAGCLRTIFQKQKCSYHYKSSLGEQDVGHVQPTIMPFDDNDIKNVIQFADGWENWENVITLACVCKS